MLNTNTSWKTSVPHLKRQYLKENSIISYKTPLLLTKFGNWFSADNLAFGILFIYAAVGEYALRLVYKICLEEGLLVLI